jgi:hypothetical protein
MEVQARRPRRRQERWECAIERSGSVDTVARAFDRDAADRGFENAPGAACTAATAKV